MITHDDGAEKSAARTTWLCVASWLVVPLVVVVVFFEPLFTDVSLLGFANRLFPPFTSRLTGDDFCMLLMHASPEDALAYANSVRAEASSVRDLEGDSSLTITMSIVIAELTLSRGDVGAHIDFDLQ